jgi:hypothetical protein
MKRKYNIKLQEMPRLTMLIKGFDTDIKNKATIFEETQLKAFMLGNMECSYWPSGVPGLGFGEDDQNE